MVALARGSSSGVSGSGKLELMTMTSCSQASTTSFTHSHALEDRRNHVQIQLRFAFFHEFGKEVKAPPSHCLVGVMYPSSIQHSLKHRLYRARPRFPKLGITNADFEVLQCDTRVRVGGNATSHAQYEKLAKWGKRVLRVIHRLWLALQLLIEVVAAICSIDWRCSATRHRCVYVFVDGIGSGPVSSSQEVGRQLVVGGTSVV